jgi:hypothetical protein
MGRSTGGVGGRGIVIGRRRKRRRDMGRKRRKRWVSDKVRDRLQ